MTTEAYTLHLTPAEADELRALVPAGTLRKRPARRFRENADYAMTVLRMLRSLAKRAGGDVDMLPVLLDMEEQIDALMRQAVTACRTDGYSWTEIAHRLGTTKQAAQQRYGRARAS